MEDFQIDFIIPQKISEFYLNRSEQSVSGDLATLLDRCKIDNVQKKRALRDALDVGSLEDKLKKIKKDMRIKDVKRKIRIIDIKKVTKVKKVIIVRKVKKVKKARKISRAVRKKGIKITLLQKDWMLIHPKFEKYKKDINYVPKSRVEEFEKKIFLLDKYIKDAKNTSIVIREDEGLDYQQKEYLITLLRKLTPSNMWYMYGHELQNNSS